MNAPILALDLGSVRIGVAIWEAAGLPAVPLTTLVHKNRAVDCRQVAALARERNVKCIVVGNPIRLDGSSGPAAEKTAAFIRDLQACFDGEVVAYDERLTTAAAAKKLQDLPVSGSKRRRYIDQLAAVEILNSYIASRRSS